MASSIKITLRLSEQRGGGNHGWLNTKHTFSFANYYDKNFYNYSTLRVLNEDRVSPSNGFGFHPHSNFCIFSYILSGQIEHQDSMGNKEVLSRGYIQYTNAGDGIQHSEINPSETENLHFLQIWFSPEQKNQKPSYETKFFSEQQKLGRLCTILAPKPEINSSIKLHQDATIFASILNSMEANKKVTYTLKQGRQVYIHVCENETKNNGLNSENAIQINGINLKRGDGAFIEINGSGNENTDINIEQVSQTNNSEFLLFDVKA